MDRTDLFKVSKLVYGTRVIVTTLYDSLEAHRLWCKGNCNELVWQLRGTQIMVQG